jgi:hypothetical protein
MLLKYENYIKEALTPEEIEERKRKAMESHMRMYISKDLADILKTIDNPIAQDLLTLSRRNIKFSYSFLDLTNSKDEKEKGKVTYIQTNKVKQLEESGLDIKAARNNYKSEIWTSNSRTEPTTIGKVAKKIFKDKYNQVEIERFSNLYKASIDKKGDKLRLVYGNDIKKWYLEENYAELKSTLGGSCMRQSEKNKYLNIYAENTPDSGSYSHIGLLILFNEFNKVLGRAIVWFNSIKPYYKEIDGKIQNIPRTFMDRVYLVSDHYLEFFIDYAKKNKWLYKQQQSYSNRKFIDPIDNSVHDLTLSFRLKPKTYDYYPYMDTICYYTPETGRIGSKKPKEMALKKYKTYELRSPGGDASLVR